MNIGNLTRYNSRQKVPQWTEASRRLYFTNSKTVTTKLKILAIISTFNLDGNKTSGSPVEGFKKKMKKCVFDQFFPNDSQ